MKTLKEKNQRHMQICRELNTLHKEKDQKYNGSFARTFEEYGPSALLIRLEDKLNRAKNLLRNPEVNLSDESIIDTLRDLANYSVQGIIELEAPLVEVLTEEDEVELGEGVEGELAEYTKGELLKLANELGLDNVNKKSSKSILISKIANLEHSIIYETLDNLFGGVDENDKKENGI